MESHSNKADFDRAKELYAAGKTRESLRLVLSYLESFGGRNLSREAINFIKEFDEGEKYCDAIEKSDFESFQSRIVFCVGGSISEDVTAGQIIEIKTPEVPFFNRSYESYLATFNKDIGTIASSSHDDLKPRPVRTNHYRFDEEKRSVLKVIDPEDLVFEKGDEVFGVEDYSLPPVHAIRKNPSLGLFVKDKSIKDKTEIDEFGQPVTPNTSATRATLASKPVKSRDGRL